MTGKNMDKKQHSELSVITKAKGSCSVSLKLTGFFGRTHAVGAPDADGDFVADPGRMLSPVWRDCG